MAQHARGVATTFQDHPTPRQRTRTWVLLSGGIDSAACLAFYLKQKAAVECLHISYGQPAAQRESAAAIAISLHFGVALTSLRCSGFGKFGAGHIVGRNAFLLLAALLHIGPFPSVLALGIHTGTPYYDCSHAFLSAVQTQFDHYCDGQVRLAAPFMEWPKSQIYSFCQDVAVPTSLTYSCESGTNPPCQVCLSCRDRRALNAL